MAESQSKIFGDVLKDCFAWDDYHLQVYCNIEYDNINMDWECWRTEG